MSDSSWVVRLVRSPLVVCDNVQVSFVPLWLLPGQTTLATIYDLQPRKFLFGRGWKGTEPKITKVKSFSQKASGRKKNLDDIVLKWRTTLQTRMGGTKQLLNGYQVWVLKNI